MDQLSIIKNYLVMEMEYNIINAIKNIRYHIVINFIIHNNCFNILVKCAIRDDAICYLVGSLDCKY